MKPQSELTVAVAVAEGEMPRGGGNGDAVKDAGEKILGYVVKYAGEAFKAKLVNNWGEKPEGDAVKDAGDEILGYVVKYAGDFLKAELVDKSGQKLERDAVKDAGDEIQGYVVKSAGETLEAELVNRSGEKLQGDNGETRKADVGEKSTDPIKGKADSSGTIKAEPAKICNKADAPETPKANSIEGCADAETNKNIDVEEGDASKEEGGDESQEQEGDEPEEKEEGDEPEEKEEGDEPEEKEEGDGSEEEEEGGESEEQEGGDESEEEEEGDESEEEGDESEEEGEEEEEEEEEGQAIEVNTKIELMDILNGWMGGRLLILVGRLPSMAEAGRLYTYINTLGGLVEVLNMEVLKMVSDLDGLIEFKVMKATTPTLREHPQHAVARGYLAKQGRQLVGRGIQIGGEFRARAEAVGNAMQAHSQLVNEPPYSVALNNLRKTLNTLLNSPVTLA